MKTRRWSVLLAACVLCSCLALYPPALAETGEKVKTDFTTEELLADYDQFWNTISERYPFAAILEEKGIDLEVLRLSERKAVETRVTTVQGLYSLLEGIFTRCDGFGHMQMLTPAGYYDHLKAMPIYPDSHEFDRLKREQTAATYALLSSNDLVGAAHRVKSEDTVQMKYYEDLHTAYFHIKTFMDDAPWNVEGDDCIARFILAHDGVENVIFDVCGNTGGLIDRVELNILSQFTHPVVYTATSYIRECEAEDAVLLYGDGVAIQPVDAMSEQDVPAFVTDLGLTHQIQTKVYYPRAEYSGQQVTKGIKRWLLIDGTSFSAADTLADICRRTGWATVVGCEATRGDGVHVLPIFYSFVLDNTGLVFRFDVDAGVNADGGLNVTDGTAPERLLVCKPKDTPLDALLRMIATEQKND